MGFSAIKRPARGEFYTPDIIEVMIPRKSIQTRTGHITPSVGNYKDYESAGYEFKAYTYLATGRFLSTQVTPTEYGDGEVFDTLLCIIHTDGVPEEALDLLRPTNIIRVRRKGYTDDEGEFYRLVTGNPYPSHVEFRAVPLID